MLTRIGSVTMAAVCLAVVVGALLLAVWVVNRVVDGVAQHVEEHTDPRPAAAAAPAPAGRQLAEIGDPVDVTATALKELTDVSAGQRRYDSATGARARRAG